MDVFRKRLAPLAALLLVASDGADPDNPPSGQLTAGYDPHAAAYWRARNEFRQLAIAGIQSLGHPCPFSRKLDRFHTRAQVREPLDGVRRLVAHGAYAQELVRAQAQAEAARPVYECWNPDRPGTDERIRQADARDSAAIRRMVQLARQY